VRAYVYACFSNQQPAVSKVQIKTKVVGHVCTLVSEQLSSHTDISLGDILDCGRTALAHAPPVGAPRLVNRCT